MKLTGDQYVELLLSRQQEWVDTHLPRPDARLPRMMPLLEWFVRDGDEHLVDIPDPQPVPKPVRQPRKYLPTSHWRTETARIHARMAALEEPLLPDRAAAGGQALGVKRTRKAMATQDRKLEEYVALQRQLEKVESKLRAAEYRESRSR